MPVKSLRARGNDLSLPENQLKYLSNGIFAGDELPTFVEKINACGHPSLTPDKLEIFQVNVGYMCNQVCSHCHVDAGPDRKEIMTRDTMRLCLDVLQKSGAHTLDITGGAPEMNPDFRWFVEEASKIGVKDFIVRSNLTIMLSNKKYYDLPEFFAKHKVHVVSSLPFYERGRTDNQRGDGVFDKSIRALIKLNKTGYGMADSDLELDLVYNPSGAFLPPDQKVLEDEFKRALMEDFGISFNTLFAITNLPISRFLEYLIASGNYEDYMYNLVEAFNPAALEGVMCKNTLSVSWDGSLFDCDFNQMLGLPVSSKCQHLKDFNASDLSNRKIFVSQHCYGCTAGAGSSCQGSTI